ncbi:LacI family DNA-binding transcriptional regulator [Sphingomonas mollis]|uniref:LacI family DNA-binding transcriptional regulator n=1 Tax=Sphingomonas mollis TaxID=2795726 RepID=A0ABS0XPK3_9SPHN|nr:LacI family DNA-binding transcriptional regulator [Sphingomonas sp. BT553]MBJ6121977.1 LacI family DNA-binding transcriptional regulator [Sphingomonas sp. BT553]
MSNGSDLGWSAEGGVPTITDVAIAASVSVRTVSRVINNSPKVNAETRIAVQRIIGEMDFTPSARAQALASGKSRLIGVIQGDENAHVLGRVQHGIAQACAPSGHELLVHPTSLSGDALIDNVRAFLRRSRVDGLIVLSPTSEDFTLAATIRRLRVPVVALASCPIDGYAAMLISRDRDGGGAVGAHLAGLGHRRIAVITGPSGRLSSLERVNGLRAELARRDITLHPGMIVEGDYTFASGHEAAERLLSQPIPPTAIFACNDLMAAAVLKVASNRGVDVPSQLSVVGFDGTDLATMLTPALTTVHRPIADIARHATDVLLTMIGAGPADRSTPLHEFFDLTFTLRESTAPPGSRAIA